MDESVKHYTLTLPNDIKAVPQLNSFMESVLPWDGTMLMTIKLALEEAVVNVMNYAYPDNVTGEVTVDVFLEEKRLRIVITDGGRPFNPTEMADVDTTLPLEKLAAGQYTLTVEAMKGDRAVARAELTFRIDDAGQKPEGQQPQGSMPKRSGAQGSAQGDGAEAAQGFRVTPGEALVSTHISGTRDMRIYGTVALTLDTDGAMTELVLGGTPLGIVLDGGDAAFTGIVEGDTLTLAAEAGEIWTLNGRALKTLSASGIARLVLCAGTGRVELDTAQALQGDVYARLRSEGFVSGDYNYQISDAGIRITVAGSAYRLGDTGELTPMEGDGSAETMVYSAGGAV